MLCTKFRRTCLLFTFYLFANVFHSVNADAICENWFGVPMKYCYGITAYCCGPHFQQCCWQSVWKIWWFWVVLSVLFVSLLSCCGYMCSSAEEGERYRLFRSGSLRNFRTWRNTPPEHEHEWKPVGVALPAYSQTQPEAETTQGAPQLNSSYVEPPPPYDTAIDHPQPETQETTPLAATTSTTSIARSYNTTASSR